jgi:hypothetical protein
MNYCSICLNDIKDKSILADCGKCKLIYHITCYKEFKNKLKKN